MSKPCGYRAQARDSYLSKVDETLEFLRQNGISGAAKHAMGMRDANTAIVPAEQDSSIVSKLAMLPPGALPEILVL